MACNHIRSWRPEKVSFCRTELLAVAWWIIEIDEQLPNGSQREMKKLSKCSACKSVILNFISKLAPSIDSK